MRHATPGSTLARYMALETIPAVSVAIVLASGARIELLVLLGDAGLRRGKATGLEWTDVELRRWAAMNVQRSD
ncbi:MAG TPA: hypothetical protein VM753_11925 [Anaeromyxobacter sp.]|nr:hypothetical protein [Anaeromyxobacter sp.]